MAKRGNSTPGTQAIDFTQPEGGQLLFLPTVFNETLKLLFEAHEYFQLRGAEEQASIPHLHRAAYAREMSHITMRLTSVMAWVMVRKAVCGGRIEEETAAQKYRLDARDICLAEISPALSDLPYYINHLAERSHALYARVSRLDDMVYGNA